MLVHGSCAAWHGDAVLILGPPGSGKSDLVLRLIQQGWRLVADDQVECGPGLVVSAPPALSGLLEVRGLGIFHGLAVEAAATLRLVIRMTERPAIPRLPLPATWPIEAGSLPLVAIDPFDASACAKVDFALGAATGRLSQRTGAFAA